VTVPPAACATAASAARPDTAISFKGPDATCHTLPEPFAALFHLSHLDIHLRHVPNPFANAHTMRRVAPASAGSRSDAQRFRVRISEARRHLGGHTFASRPPPFAPLRYRQSSVPLVDRNAAHVDEHPRLVHRNAPLVGDNDTLVPGNDPYVRRNDTRVPRNDTHVLGNLALVRGYLACVATNASEVPTTIDLTFREPRARSRNERVVPWNLRVVPGTSDATFSERCARSREMRSFLGTMR
jgi:hypothetical protein